MALSRRSLMQWAGLGLAASAAPPAWGAAAAGWAPAAGLSRAEADRQFGGLRVGIASYSLRKFSYAECLADAQRMGIRYLSLKEMHLPLSSTQAERQQARQQAEAMGLTITSCGVLYLKDDDQSMRTALDYTRDLGASVAVVGVTAAMLPRLHRIMQDYDLRAAIHNHGPGDPRFPSPLEVYTAVQPFDRKIGVCMDIGHTFRTGEDLVSDVHKCFDRLYSMHFKDLRSRVKNLGVPVGTGLLPILPVLHTLRAMGYGNEVQLEYEAEMNDPVPGMEESFGFMRGALQVMAGA